MQNFEYLFVADDGTGPWEQRNISGKELVETTLNTYAKEGWRVIYFQASNLGLAFNALLERPLKNLEE